MIDFAPAPAANTACCEVSLYQLLVLLVPLAIAADGVGPWEIAGHAVSLGRDGRGDIKIGIEAPPTSTHAGLGGIDPVGGNKPRKKRAQDGNR